MSKVSNHGRFRDFLFICEKLGLERWTALLTNYAPGELK